MKSISNLRQGQMHQSYPRAQQALVGRVFLSQVPHHTKITHLL